MCRGRYAVAIVAALGAAGCGRIGYPALDGGARAADAAVAAPDGPSITPDAAPDITPDAAPVGSDAAAAVDTPPPSGRVPVLSGSYAGDGAAGRRIAGLGFRPTLLLVRPRANSHTVLATATMPPGTSKLLSTARFDTSTAWVQALEADGFLLGPDAAVNAAGTTYDWFALADDSARARVGSYTGNGSSQTVAVGFAPAFVMTVRFTDVAVYRTRSMGNTLALYGSELVNEITALGPNGFTVGSTSKVNTSGDRYHYVAWADIPGQARVGVFTGDNQDDRTVTGVGFMPELAIVQCLSAQAFLAVLKTRSMGADVDVAAALHAMQPAANTVQRLLPDGFQVGSANQVNHAGDPCYWTAFGR